MQPHLTWSAPEYHHTPKTREWYTAVFIITTTVAVLSVIFGNVIFAIFVLLSAFALCVHAAKPPEIITLELNSRGVLVKNILFPYKTLESFWVEMETDIPKILIKSKKLFMPYIILPIHEEDAEDAREILLAYLKEEEHVEPLSQKLMEKLGF